MYKMNESCVLGLNKEYMNNSYPKYYIHINSPQESPNSIKALLVRGETLNESLLLETSHQTPDLVAKALCTEFRDLQNYLSL